MTDIVERLRDEHKQPMRPIAKGRLLEEAADEIERLRTVTKKALIKAGCTSPDGTFVHASTNQVIAALSGKEEA